MMCRELGVDYHESCKLYDSKGAEVFEDDLVMLESTEVLYVAPEGRTSKARGKVRSQRLLR